MSSPQIVLSPLPTSKQFTRRILTVNNPMIVGRSTALQLKSLENSLFESPIISRNHGIFSFKNGRFYYLDNHSLNGSSLNGNKVKPGEETQLREEDSLMLGKQEDNDKIVAKIILRYPFLGESLIPSSLDVVEESNVDKTGSFDDLIALLETNKQRTPYEETSLEKMKEAKNIVNELGVSKKEALERVGF